MLPPNGWFCALLETATEVYFRYSLAPARRFAYISPSVETLTGRGAAEFYADRDLCLTLVSATDRRELRRLLRARRAATRLHLLRDGVIVPIDIRTVAIVRQRRLIAIEGVATLAIGAQGASAPPQSAPATHPAGQEPAQQKLASLMVEVHTLLHRVFPPSVAPANERARTLRLGELVFDLDRFTVVDAGQPVALTPRELQLLRYLLERPGRVVTRTQLLNDVWSYTYTGDDRSVDVHVSRLRRKLPSLRGRLIALRNLGYRIEEEREEKAAAAR